MSAQSKTEEATPKKRRDSAQKGQNVKARDVIVACVTLCGTLAISAASLNEIGAILIEMMRRGFDVDGAAYVRSLLIAGVKVAAPVVLVCIVATAVPSLLQSRFVMATKAIRIDFGALNPIRGFKKIFNLRTIKDFVKALLYLAIFALAFWIVWTRNRPALFGQFNAGIQDVVVIWKDLLLELVFVCLGCSIVVFVLDVLAELFIYRKDLRMAKDEVKREHKESEGSPEIKSRRKEAHMELLSEQDKHDIQASKMIIANPTHVAIGIYFNPDVLPLPYVSICERNQRAVAVRRYAEKIGIPVIVDVALARRMYKTHKRYGVVGLDEFQPVLTLLMWLREVETGGLDSSPGGGDVVVAPGTETGAERTPTTGGATAPPGGEASVSAPAAEDGETSARDQAPPK
ncbi:EscU/YscU/HrcU family type III secretion system export apparatus switch protein [Burkholderia ubonensis]|uniref:EscU/YscU/HrcU family type III secretion system export apparatus switch protein n=1 Tax=Burkholderia ubonensis TaxID=101571 RepID=UPI0007C7331C|nr:EscU/YscU/HrcU family type III secretion system export apparatus switch protein [Burkholderia ubonensis]